MAETPLISCLMVTRPTADRLPRLKHSVADYLRQTHPRRELVIVVDGREAEPTTAAIRSHIAGLGRDDVRLIEPGPKAGSLGALRNVSRAEARGEVLCQWDDDDLHHPDRLARQWAAMNAEDAEALLLQHVMQFVAAKRRLYCLNWFNHPGMAHPATLMCRASAPIAYPERGPEANLGEDVVVVDQLQGRGRYCVLPEQPGLYVYVSHASNAYSAIHHQNLINSLALSQGLMRRREAALRDGLAQQDFGTGPVTVCGPTGPAFVLSN